MDEHLIKRLIATIKCGTCGKSYREDRVEIVEHDEDVWFLQVFCSSCKVKSLVAAVIQKKKKAEAINDLTGAEIARFQHLDAAQMKLSPELRSLLEKVALASSRGSSKAPSTGDISNPVPYCEEWGLVSKMKYSTADMLEPP